MVVSLELPAGAEARHARDPVRRAAIEAVKQRVLDAFSAELEVVYRYDGSASIAIKAPRSVIDRLRSAPFVRAITPNRTVYPALDQTSLLINADEARDTWGVRGDGVVVAVIDSGIDTDHPDLSDDILYQRCFSESGTCPGGTTSASGPGAAEDTFGHGTNVSGILTGNGTTSPKGIAPDAKIAAYRIFAPNGTGSYADILAALNDVLMNHPEVDIINMSISDTVNWTSACDSIDPDGANLINMLRSSGVLTFVASGNNGYTGGITWPACLSNTVSVGAVWDETLPTVSFWNCTQTPALADAVACFSNSSSELDMLAPGAFIAATSNGGGQAVYGGTSQASPVAAAVGALALEANATLTPAQLESLLEASGELITDERNGIARPRVDAAAAVLAASPDTDGDGLPAIVDNCPAVENADQTNTDKNARPNGPLLAGDDATWPMSDGDGDACDGDDDNDGLSDDDEASGAGCTGIATNPLLHDHDGDGLTDGWECAHLTEAVPSHPTNPLMAFKGTGSDDADGDRVTDLWELRGYNGSAVNADSDGDGCPDLVETASVDANRTIGDTDRLAVARRALGIWASNPEHDVVLDLDKNGAVGDPDRLFVARAALLPSWQPKTCP